MHKDKYIEIFKKTEALLEGHFILTSGRHSPSYFQCAKVLQYPQYLSLFSSELFDKFSNTNIDKIITPAVGGIVIGTEVGRLFEKPTIFAERENGTMTLRRGFTIEENEKVLVIEDVVTTGGSVKEVMDLVLNKKGLVAGVGIIVDRSNGAVDLHQNQISLVSLEVESYSDEDMPLSLKSIPVQKPGSRSIK
tara:strand:+ start:780 stop:1355 length:576 start_codon:yes stop_codon:yes gene_type:complete